MKGYIKNDVLTRIIAPILFSLYCFVILASCTKIILVDQIILDKSSLEMTVGEIYSLKYMITPNDAHDKRLLWSSSDISVATVDSYGTITATGSGSATISVESNDGGAKATCIVVVTINTEPSYSITTELIPLQSFRLYKDEISISYKKKVVKQTNPYANITNEQIEHLQDSINKSKACFIDQPQYHSFLWYFPVSVEINGIPYTSLNCSIDFYLSYGVDDLCEDKSEMEVYYERKRMIDTLRIDTVIDAFSSANLKGYSLTKWIHDGWQKSSNGYNYSGKDYITPQICFGSKSDRDTYWLGAFYNGKGQDVHMPTNPFKIPNYDSHVEKSYKTLFNLIYDRFNDRHYYDSEGNEYLTIVSENTLDKISGFKMNSKAISDPSWYYIFTNFPVAEYVYPTILFYKNGEFLHETVLMSYTEYFGYDHEKQLTWTEISFESIFLYDEGMINFWYINLYGVWRFEFSLTDYSTGEFVRSSQKTIIERDYKANEKAIDNNIINYV